MAQEPGAVSVSTRADSEGLRVDSYNCKVVASLLTRSAKGRVVGGGGAIALED